jgi:iron complex outermembrane receptor protein
LVSLAPVYPMPRCRRDRPPVFFSGRFPCLIFACLLFAGLALCRASAAEERRAFDVPVGDAAETLKLAARQGGLEIIFFAETVRGVRTLAVRGEFPRREALARLVANTGLVVGPNEKNGTLTIQRAQPLSAPPTPSPASSLATRPSQAHPKPMKRKTSLAVLGAWLALALAPAPVGLAAETGGSVVSAQPKPAEETIQLDPFVVNQQTTKGYAATSSLSATRVNTPVREIPATINIVTKEFMADFGRTTVEQAIQQVGGVANRGRNEGHYQEYFMIRGFNSTLNLKNGVPYNIFTDASNVEQVEVVKGPQTVLYGLADPGGLVNIITKKPLPVRRQEIAFKFGSEDFRRGEFDSTGPLLEGGKLLYRATGSYEKSKSWLCFGRSEQTFFTPAITWRPLVDTKIDLEYTYQWRNHAFQRPALPIDAAATRRLVNDRYYSTITPDDDSTVRGDAIEANVTQRFGRHVTVKATAADVRRSTDMYNYVGAIAQPVTTAGVLTGYRFTPIANIEELAGRERHYYVDVNARDLHFGPTTHNLILGYQQDESRSTNANWRLAQPAAAFDPLNPPDVVRLTTTRTELRARNDLLQLGIVPLTTNRGVFLIDQIKTFEDRLTILGGLRYDDLGGAGHRTTPQGGASFALTKTLNVYGLYSESYVPNPSRLDAGLGRIVDFPPSESRGLDFGFKADLLEGKLSATVSYFNIERSNIPQPSPLFPPPAGQPQFLLSGLEGSEGVEVEAFYNPTANWQFVFSYAHTKARILESVRAIDVGLQLPQTSPDSFSLTTRYNFTAGPLKGVTAGALVIRRNGPIPDFGTYANRLIFENGWTRLDLFVAYPTRVFGVATRFSLNVNNATDAVYLERFGMYNPPRQVFVQTRFSF